jgi:endonuclease YncB( thermonuclease family)
MIYLFTLFITFSSIFANAAEVSPIEVRVEEVLKGDSFVVVDRNGQASYLYLLGIDCPELNQEGGNEAKAFSRSKVLKKRVIVDVVETTGNQMYGFVRPSFGELDLGSQLLSSGFAWYDESEFDKLSTVQKSSYSLLADSAKVKKKGIWRSGNFQRFNAMNPRSFRDLKRDQIDQPRFNGTEDPKFSGFGRRRVYPPKDLYDR